MKLIAITGGIGSGKSVVAHLVQVMGYQVYDCDSRAKALMTSNEEVRSLLTKAFGRETYLEDGSLNRQHLSAMAFGNAETLARLNAIVHPAVFADFLQSGLDWLESAIMYESGADRYVDRIVVVTAPEEVRIERIMRRDGITRSQALEWIARQWPQDKVRQLAHYEIVNDGQQDIDKQLNILLEQLCNKPF